MAQVIVRKLEEAVKRKLQRRAARHGCSMEEEARDILREAVKGEMDVKRGLGSAIAARFNGIEPDTTIKKLQIDIRAPTFD